MRLSNLFRTKTHAPAAQTKSAVIGLNDELSQLLSLSSSNGSTPASALRLYEQSSAVSVPVNKVGDAFASLTPVLETDGKVETEHDVLSLLRRPSPFFTGDLFLEALGKNYLITGEAGVVATGTVNRPPLELWAITPSNISVNEGPGGIPANYYVTGSTATGTYLYQTTRGQARYLDGTLRELKHIPRGASAHPRELAQRQPPGERGPRLLGLPLRPGHGR